MKRPYRIKSVVLITYDGQRIPIEMVSSEIVDKPIKLMKELLLDAFSMMKNKPVDVKLSVVYV